MNPQKNAQKTGGTSSRRDLTNTMICWTPGVTLIPWPDRNALSRAYSRSVGACFGATRRMSFGNRKTLVFITAVQLIVRDGCAPSAVHAAFLGLDEYLDGCSSDMPGVWELRQRVGEEPTA